MNPKITAVCPVNVAYWGYGVSGYTENETGQRWQGHGYGYGYYQAYSAGYQQGLNDAQLH